MGISPGFVLADSIQMSSASPNFQSQLGDAGRECLKIQAMRLEKMPLAFTPDANCRDKPAATIIFEKGLALYLRDDYVQALRYFGRGVTQDPNDEEFYFYFPDTLSRTGNIKDAIQGLEDFIQHFPHHPLVPLAKKRLAELKETNKDSR